MANSGGSMAVVTKARAMYGKRLSRDDYAELLSKRTVADIAAYLKETPRYQKIFADVSSERFHRAQFESILRRALYETYVRLMRYEEEPDEGFHRYLQVRSDIEEILDQIMFLNAGETEKLIVELPGYLIEHAGINMIALAKANNFDELLSALAGTPYVKLLQPFHTEKGGAVNYRGCEVALYTYYYATMIESVERRFWGKTRKELLASIRTRIDLDNMVTVFRLKQYFDAPPEEIRAVLLPFHGELTPKRLEPMIVAKDQEALLKALHATPFGKEFEDVQPNRLEIAARRMLAKHFHRSLRNSIDAAQSLYAFLSLSEMELDNVIHIVEGAHYRVPKAEIEELLIM